MSANRLRRVLSRVCTARAMERIVDPILADIEAEPHRPRWRGYLDLASALAAHGVLALPRAAKHALIDDEYMLPKAALLSLAVAVGGACLLMAWPMTALRVTAPAALVLLAPQALMLTVPAALLVALPVALRRVSPSRQVLRRILLLTVSLVGVTLVLARDVPSANQAFRVLTAGQPVPRGVNELSFSELRDKIEILNLTPGGRKAARPIEYIYQVRVALIFAPIPLALLALAIARCRFGQRWPISTGVVAMALYVTALFPAASLAIGVLIHSGTAPAFRLAWIPNALTLLFALTVQRSTIETPPKPWTTLPPPGSSNDRIS